MPGPTTLSTGVGARTSIFGFDEPASEPDVFADLITTVDQAELDDTSVWTRQSSDASLAFLPAGKGTRGLREDGSGTPAGANARYFGINTPSVASGRKLGSASYVSSMDGGVTRSVTNGSSSRTGSISSPAWLMTGISATALGSVRSQTLFGVSVNGVLESDYVFDIDAMAAKPWAIVLVVAQSNWVGATRVVDPAIDTPAWGCLVWPGNANTARGYAFDGSGNGIPALAVEPVAHQYPANLGGGPSTAFLKEFRKFIPETYTPMYVATGYSGAAFSGSGYWYSGSSPRTAYDGFWKQARACWDAAPAGSFIAGIIFCQGESDIGSGSQAQWAVRVPAMLDEIQSEPGWQGLKGSGDTFGDIPIVIAEIGGDIAAGDSDATSYLNMIAQQQKLATGSGDALERPRCKYVPRPADWSPLYNGDGLNVHYMQPVDRERGYDVARALHDLIYP